MGEWNELYKKGFRGRYPNEDVIRFINRNFPNREERKSIKILDWGCGTGRHVIYLAKEGFNSYGIEIANFGIDLIRIWLKQEGLNADLRKVDGVVLPFPDRYFDAVIDCASIQHNKLEEIRKIILEIYRVLKKGGKVFSYCKCKEDSLYGKGREIEEDTFYYEIETETPTIIYFFTKEKIQLLWAKFENIEIEYTERTIKNMTEKGAHFVVTMTK